jgi:hypothetical protein
MKPTYIAGPMSNLPQSNYPAFFAAEAALRACGFDVENPARNLPPPCGTWLGYMRIALRQLSHCDGVVMLPGWIWSRGARIEWLLAKLLGLQVQSLKRALRGYD